MFKVKLLFRSISKCQVEEHINKLSTAAPKEKKKHKMKAWQIHSYGELNELQLSHPRIPVISDPNDVFIKVHAASLNPIDVAMITGYGRTILGVFRGSELEFPLTLGRDFAGEVANKGHGVGDEFILGEQVYGIVPLHRQGSHAEAVVVDKSHIRKKPSFLTAVEAASIPYAAMTAWSALYLTGELIIRPAQRSTVLVLGASGGVGCMAVQILKSQGAIVMGTCAKDAAPLVASLGAHNVFDYTDAQFEKNVADEGKFDIILDCAKFGHQNIPSTWKYDRFITLNSPLLYNTDNYGLLGGLAASAGNLINCNMSKCAAGRSVRWGFFVASNDGLRFIDSLVHRSQLTPMIHKVFPFRELPKAFETMAAGHLRGKIVINLQEN